VTERKDRQTGPCPFYNVDCEYVPMAHRAVELENEIERLREALKFYADRQNYEDRPYGQWPKVRDDEGGIARAALKGNE
jgi:hypothetical protein